MHGMGVREPLWSIYGKLTTDASHQFARERDIRSRMNRADRASAHDDHPSTIRLGALPPPSPSPRSGRRTTAAFQPRTERRACARLRAARTRVRPGLHAQPVAHGGDRPSPCTGLIEILQLWAPGRHARLEDFVVDALAACVGLARRRRRSIWSIKRTQRSPPLASWTRKSPRDDAREDRFMKRLRSLVDDLDDLAGARLHDHAAIIDDRVAIFGVARHRRAARRLAAAARRPRRARAPRPNGRARGTAT